MDLRKPVSAEVENNKLMRLLFVGYLKTHHIKFIEDKNALKELGVYIFNCYFKSNEQFKKTNKRTKALFYQSI